MITEDYCSFELSKLLKENGFDGYDWCCSHVYTSWQMLINGIPTNDDDFTYAPTHQMAMKWLREGHNIIIVIEPHSYNYMEEKTSSYDFSIWIGDNYEHPFTTNYPTYEEAIEAAIKYSLNFI